MMASHEAEDEESNRKRNQSCIGKRRRRKRRALRSTESRDVKVFSGVRHSEGLFRESMWLWENAGGGRLQAKSFWIGREDTPRSALESFAQACASYHNPDYIGAEYWVQVREGKEGDEGGLSFHFDKDERMLNELDSWCHPHTSTVTYLNSGDPDSLWGAPLVIFNTTSTDAPPSSRPQPSASWVLCPKPGNHVSFPGNLLHGVPSELNNHLYGQLALSSNSKSFMRVSLPVNIWVHHAPISVQRMPKKSQMELSDQVEMLPKENVLLFDPSSLRRERLMQLDVPQYAAMDMEDRCQRSRIEDTFFLSEHVDGSTSCLPLKQIRQAFTSKSEDEGAFCPGLKCLYH